ncbi:GSCOCG00003793001-RA-CDS, partial [Cotesia congregata]
MSFCRITGRSRGLPKPNYFPLLPPISPADAKRFCRITGKSYGLPTHHYIPVLLGVHKTDKSKCRVTNNNSGVHHQFTAGLILGGDKRKHVVVKDFRYVFPVLEGDGEQQKALRELLSTKEPLDDSEENLKFVYTVNERRTSLVFPAQLEAAVRDGDVKDVMLSRDCDTVLLRLKQGKNLAVDFRDFDSSLESLYDGLGPREDILKERERLEAAARKRKKKKASGLNYAKKIFEDKEKADEAEEMAQIVSTVSHLATNIVNEYQNSDKPNFESFNIGHDSKLLTNGVHHHQNGHSEDEEWLHEAVKGAIATAILAITDLEDPASDEKSYVLSSISEAFNVFLRQGSSSIEHSVEQVLKILTVPQSRTALCQTAVIDLLESTSNKVDLLKSTIVRQSLKSDTVLERLSAVLEEEHGSDLVGSAFRAVSKDDPELVSRVLEKVSREVAGVATEREAAETVHKAIVHAVRESSELQVKELLNDGYDGNNNNSDNLRELILQAVGLARALGMSSTASSLLTVISDEKSSKLLANDRVTLDILKRLTVMRKLAEERPQFIAALRDLTSDPDMARSDPHLRTLVRESAALMIVPEDAPLQSSVDVPTALLNAENSLAIEDFLIRKSHRPSTIFMILKHGLQAVVPREASRAVLTGQVAYTVLDENGITHFEPLHVFNALRLNKPTAHRFSMYACPVAGEDDFELESVASFGNFNGNPYTDSVSSLSSANGRYYSSQDCSSGVTLTRSDRTLENSVSRENTPCFRRLS